MKKWIGILFVLALVALTAACNKKEEEMEPETYSNPVFEPVFADPSAIRDEDGYYYVFGTQDYGEWGEEYGTAYVPILKSKDLIEYEYAGSAFTLKTRPTWGTANAGIWAPDIVKIGDQYLLYYSLSTWGDPNPGIGVATADHPLGPWTDHGKLFDSESIGVNNSIDPTVFTAEDGKVYMVWGSFRGIYGVELTADGLALADGENAINTKVHLAGYDTSTEWNGTTYEGAYIRYINGYYYMFLSQGTCCDGFNSSYNVKVCRSETPLGEYVDSDGNSMLAGNRGHQVVKGSSAFAGTGHNALVQDDNQDWWIIYHAYDRSEPETIGNTSRRSLMIDKLEWTEEGWPETKYTYPAAGETEDPMINNQKKN